MIVETSFWILWGIETGLGGVMCQNKFKPVLGWVYGGRDWVIFVMMIQKWTLPSFIDQVNIFIAQIVWIELD